MVAGLILVQTAGNEAPTAHRHRGLITVGDATNVWGDLNSTDESAIREALKQAGPGGEVKLLSNGAWSFTSNITVPWDDVKIQGGGSSTISANNPLATGLFLVTGKRFRMHGVKQQVNAHVNGQTGIFVTGGSPEFAFNTFETTVDTGTPSTTNAHRYVVCGTTAQGIAGGAFFMNTFLPGKSTMCVEIAGDPNSGTTSGTGSKFIGNQFGPEDGTTRKCYVGVWFNSAGECLFNSNRARGLGDGVDLGFSFLYFTTAAAQSEAQHAEISGNNLELVSAHHVLRSDGARFFNIVGGIVGRCLGSAAGEGTFHFTENTGAGTDGIQIEIVGVNFHNAAASAGRVLRFDNVAEVKVANCSFGLLNGRAIHVAVTAIGVTIESNSFTGVSSGSIIETVGGDYTRYITRNNTIPSGCTLHTGAPNVGDGKKACLTGLFDKFGGNYIQAASGAHATVIADLDTNAIWT